MGDIYDPYYADDETGYFYSVTDYIRIPIHRPKKIKMGLRVLNNKRSKRLKHGERLVRYRCTVLRPCI